MLHDSRVRTVVQWNNPNMRWQHVLRKETTSPPHCPLPPSPHHMHCATHPAVITHSSPMFCVTCTSPLPCCAPVLCSVRALLTLLGATGTAYGVRLKLAMHSVTYVMSYVAHMSMSRGMFSKSVLSYLPGWLHGAPRGRHSMGTCIIQVVVAALALCVKTCAV